jgi:hypothetical protein
MDMIFIYHLTIKIGYIIKMISFYRVIILNGINSVHVHVGVQSQFNKENMKYEIIHAEEPIRQESCNFFLNIEARERIHRPW